MFVIAGIGVNHSGNMENAKKLIDAASNAGCALVRFDKRTVEAVYTTEYLSSPLQSTPGTTMRQHLHSLEFSLQQYREIDAYCKEKNIGWFTSAWDVQALQEMREFKLEHSMVCEEMLGNTTLLNAVANEGKHTYINASMASWEQIETALAIFSGCPYTLMHGCCGFGADEEQTNLHMMQVLRERYFCPVGYCGYEVDSFASTMAFIMGANAIERPLTLDRTIPGENHANALHPDEMYGFLQRLQRVLKVKGDGLRMCSIDKTLLTKYRVY